MSHNFDRSTVLCGFKPDVHVLRSEASLLRSFSFFAGTHVFRWNRQWNSWRSTTERQCTTNQGRFSINVVSLCFHRRHCTPPGPNRSSSSINSIASHLITWCHLRAHTCNEHVIQSGQSHCTVATFHAQRAEPTCSLFTLPEIVCSLISRFFLSEVRPSQRLKLPTAKLPCTHSS